MMGDVECEPSDLHTGKLVQVAMVSSRSPTLALDVSADYRVGHYDLKMSDLSDHMFILTHVQ